jgi:hypothetical protein
MGDETRDDRNSSIGNCVIKSGNWIDDRNGDEFEMKTKTGTKTPTERKIPEVTKLKRTFGSPQFSSSGEMP